MEEAERNKRRIPEEPRFRQYLGTVISGFVLLGTVSFIVMGFWIINIVVTHNPPGQDPTDKLIKVLQTLFTAILPLFGTWIGTVLAFYYTKENLQAANESIRDLVGKVTSAKKLESTKAKDVMIPIEKLLYMEFKSTDDPASLLLKENFHDYLTREGISRVILLNEHKHAKYVIHRSIIERFIALQYFSQRARQVGDDQADELESIASTATFADLLQSDDDQIRGILKDGINFISIEATLSVAKALMSNKYCQDVFITKGGQSNEPVLGWITNKTIEENSLVD